MRKIRVSAVKYTNSIPFIYGLKHFHLNGDISLSLDTPAECYTNLISGRADIGLVPVVIRNEMKDIRQVSDYIIGADGKVMSVELISQCPVEEVKTIVLDYQSKTSVKLTKLLCRDFWKISPEFINSKPGFEDTPLKNNEARLVIGDRSFHFRHRNGILLTDLAEEWKKHTGLPFVFAFWGSVNGLPEGFDRKFHDALEYGLSQKSRLAADMASLPEYASIDLPEYLDRIIIHEMSPSLREGMNLFLHLIRDL